MASYHFTTTHVSMGKGQSAVHTAAYNNRCQLHDERHDRDTKHYGYKGAPEFSGIFAPKDAPEWTHDRDQLWNRAEAAERQANGRPARKVEFSLPHELDAEQRRRLVTDFVRETFSRRGMVADVNIHEPHDGNDERNYHVHCLLTMRRLDGDDFAKTKERQWDKKEELAQWREKWAQMGGRALERAGHEQEADRFRHGHKTLAGQREAALARGDNEWAQHCDKEAQIHKGPAVSAMEQRDDPRLADNDIAQASRAIDERNALRAEIRETQKELNGARQAEAEATTARNPAAGHPAYTPEPEKVQEPLRAEFRETENELNDPRQMEPEKVQPAAERWHSRDATKTEEKIFHVMDSAERGGPKVAAGLFAEGITLARVDAAGKAELDREHHAKYGGQQSAANVDPWMMEKGGAGSLSPESRESAERSYANWREKIRKRRRGMGLRVTSITCRSVGRRTSRAMRTRDYAPHPSRRGSLSRSISGGMSRGLIRVSSTPKNWNVPLLVAKSRRPRYRQRVNFLRR